MIILSKVLKESNQIKILAIRVAAKRTLDNALLLIRILIKTCDKFSEDLGGIFRGNKGERIGAKHCSSLCSQSEGREDGW